MDEKFINCCPISFKSCVFVLFTFFPWFITCMIGKIERTSPPHTLAHDFVIFLGTSYIIMSIVSSFHVSYLLNLVEMLICFQPSLLTFSNLIFKFCNHFLKNPYLNNKICSFTFSLMDALIPSFFLFMVPCKESKWVISNASFMFEDVALRLRVFGVFGALSIILLDFVAPYECFPL